MDMSPIAAGAFARLLESVTGQQLAAGRRWRIETALNPLMRGAGIDTLDELAVRIGREREAALRQKVVEALLNNETSFYRDIASFRAIVEEVLPALAARRPQRRFSIWSAGCSTGQEAYSLALALRRHATRWAGWDFRILATDISETAIAQARSGLYSHFEIQRGLPITEMMQAFEPDGDSWRARVDLRQRIEFRQHNLLEPPPGGSFDLILCRNVLLYFSAERRRAVLDGLAGAIALDGLLMLGAGETVLGSTEAFAASPLQKGFYRRTAEKRAA